jgi:hypothetical protein
MYRIPPAASLSSAGLHLLTDDPEEAFEVHRPLCVRRLAVFPLTAMPSSSAVRLRWMSSHWTVHPI